MDSQFEYSEVEAEARKMAARRNSLVMAAEVSVIFILPVVENILIQSMDHLHSKRIFWPLILLVGSVHILLGFKVILPTRNEFFYFEFLDQKNRYKELLRKYNRADATGRVVYLALKYLRNFIGVSKSRSRTLSVDDIGSYLGKIINTAVLNRDGVLGLTLSDRYSFIVYMYSPDENVLKPFYSAQDNRIKNETRDWKPYQGPVGMCFANKRLEIIKDLSESTTYRQEYTNPGDDKNYRSLAVIPIFYDDPGANEKTVIGVLQISSSKAACFVEDVHAPIFESLADILDVFLVFAQSQLPPNTKFV
jgi:hypothetical protein